MLPRVMKIAAGKPSLFRLLLIMSFLEKPGMIGSVHRARELYGRVTQAHLTSERERVRADRLTD